MKDYIQKILKLKVETSKYDTRKFPMFLTWLFDICYAQSESIGWVVATPKQKMDLRDLKRFFRRIEATTGEHTAIYLTDATAYVKNSLLEEGIPFVIENRDIYLPFLGMYISPEKPKILKQVDKISFLTQKIILTAIYERWEGKTVTQIAEELKVSKTAVGKAMDEMESCRIPVIWSKGKRRVVGINMPLRKLWNELLPALRNPVIKRIESDIDCNVNFKCGISALSDYSMLNDNEYYTVGILKKDFKKLPEDIKERKLLSARKKCEILELGYSINFRDENRMDPLSILLSLTEEEKHDERVMGAIEDMLEEYVW